MLPLIIIPRATSSSSVVNTVTGSEFIIVLPLPVIVIPSSATAPLVDIKRWDINTITKNLICLMNFIISTSYGVELTHSKTVNSMILY